MENTVYFRKKGHLFEDKITIRGPNGTLIPAILIAEKIGEATAVDPEDRNKILATGKIELRKTINDGGTPGRTMYFKYGKRKSVLNKAFLTGRL